MVLVNETVVLANETVVLVWCGVAAQDNGVAGIVVLVIQE